MSESLRIKKASDKDKIHKVTTDITMRRIPGRRYNHKPQELRNIIMSKAMERLVPALRLEIYKFL